MKQKINIKYCQNCGGVTQWEEFLPTNTATMGNTIVKPNPLTFYLNGLTPAGQAVTTTGMRICGCTELSGNVYGI